MRLSEIAAGRDNNFNLVRLVAALAVLLSHSFVVVTGKHESEPLLTALGMTPGSIAVDVFFITSGFLVTASLLNRRSMIEFVAARVLRIYPALVVMVVVSIILLGSFYSSMSFGKFISDPDTWRYAYKNSSLWFGVTGYLPGVFTEVPFANKVNASLWTMPLEVKMYAILALIWVVSITLGSYSQKALRSIIVLLTLGAMAVHFRDHFIENQIDHFHRLIFMFFSGATCYVFRDRILFHKNSGVIGLAIIVAATFLNRDIFFIFYHMVLAYLVLWLAYVPGGVIRSYNKIGDYSYGVYIYAFPVQQSVVATFPNASILNVSLLSVLVTTTLAALSWHLLEVRALRIKYYFQKR